jgi:uncharacterized protein YukE
MTMTGEEIYQNFSGKSSESLQLAAIQVTGIAQSYQDIASRFAKVQERMMASWTGGAAESAHAGAAPLPDTLSVSAERLNSYGSAHGNQTTAFETAVRDVQPMPEKPTMPNPIEFAKQLVTGGPQVLADHLAKVEAYQAAAEHNVTVMNAYQGATGVNQQIPVDYPRPDGSGGSVTKEVPGAPPDNPITSTVTETKTKQGDGDGDGDGGTSSSTGSSSAGGPGAGAIGIGGTGPSSGGGPTLTSTSGTGGGPSPVPSPVPPGSSSGSTGSFGAVQGNPNPSSKIPDCGRPSRPVPPDGGTNSTDPTDVDELTDPIDTTTASLAGAADGPDATVGWGGGGGGRFTSDAWSTGGDGTGRGGVAAGAGGVAGVGGSGVPGGAGAGLAGAARGRPGAGGFGAVPPGSRRDEEDKEHTRLDFLFEPDPNAVFGTDQPSSSPVIGETWKLEDE